MRLFVDKEGLELAKRADELGRQSKQQDEIAEELGFRDKWALQRALKDAGYQLARENRVRIVINNVRLADAVEAGTIVADEAPTLADVA